MRLVDEGLSPMKAALRGSKDITMRVAGRIFNNTVWGKRNVTNNYNLSKENE
jgi:hypothetical protein